MRCSRPALMILFLSQVIAAPTIAGERKTPRTTHKAAIASSLDRIAFAVDGAESSHGTNEAMWRPDPTGPQGPMQVTEAAASDVGGGDRFDVAQNREIGRAYLAQLYRRYGNWPDAIAAYNWGIGNFDAWIKAGRPADGAIAGVSAYLARVLDDSGLCDAGPTKGAARQPSAPVDCTDLAAFVDAPGARKPGLSLGTQRFYAQLGNAVRLTAQHAGKGRR